MLVGQDLIDALDALLERHPAGEDAPYLSYIDGALAGLLLAPDPIPSEEWLPRLGAGPEVAFEDPADRDRLISLLQDRKSEIAGELLLGGLTFAPVYDLDDQRRPVWQIWLMGFAGAIALRWENWEALLTSEDEDIGAAMMGLMSLLTTLPGFADAIPQDEPLDDLDELAEDAPDILPYFVETVYRRQRGLQRVVMADGPPPALPKVGRNDPCPCGSGKKFKKCCGG